MRFDRFMIAPLNAGLVTAVRPWLVPNNAFSVMKNAYVYYDRVRKRFGSYWMGDGMTQSLTRLKVMIGTTTSSGNLAVTQIPNATFPTATLQAGSLFSVGSIYFTVTTLPTTAGQTVATLSTDFTAQGAVTLFSIAPNVYEFSITGSQATIASSPVYWYPATPVMGLITYEQGSVNYDQTIAFDTTYAYQYNTTFGWVRLNDEATNSGESIWSGSDSQFFWGTTWRGATGAERYLFVTNDNQADGLRYYDGTNWHFFNPITLTDAGNNLITASIVTVFKNRLVYLDTTENVNGTVLTFVNRARYAVLGDPTATNAFNASIPGNGNSIDAATSEAIVSIGYIKDRLIVNFEKSVWELAYTGNQVYPFVWQKLNTELGAESTYSSVPFDKQVLTVSAIGVHSCNGSNVQRIDSNIPLETFKINNLSSGPYRVNGIRDYFTELVYWTFPNNSHNNGYYPNQILVYNYLAGAWAFFDDTITCFGYFQPQAGISWNSATSWNSDVVWDSGANQYEFRQVIAGNQEGFIFVCDSEQENRNSGNLQITNIDSTGTILTVINNNIDQGAYILVENAVNCNSSQCSTTLNNLNGMIFYVNSVGTNTLTISFPSGFTYSGGTYQGGGTVATVSKIDIWTKQFNFYAKDGKNAFINKVDFLVDRVDGATISVDYFASSNDASLVQAGIASGSQLGNGTLDLGPYPYNQQEMGQDRLWHPVYPNAEGEVIQLRIYYNDAEMLDGTSSLQPFEMHAFTLYATPVGRLQ